MTKTPSKSSTSIQNILLSALAVTFGYAIFVAINKSLETEATSSACGSCK